MNCSVSGRATKSGQDKTFHGSPPEAQYLSWFLRARRLFGRCLGGSLVRLVLSLSPHRPQIDQHLRHGLKCPYTPQATPRGRPWCSPAVWCQGYGPAGATCAFTLLWKKLIELFVGKVNDEVARNLVIVSMVTPGAVMSDA